MTRASARRRTKSARWCSSGKSFNKQTREAVEALYIPTERMDRILEADTKRFQDAMFRAGLEPSLKLNGVEMITALANRYESGRRSQPGRGRVRLQQEGLRGSRRRRRSQVPSVDPPPAAGLDPARPVREQLSRTGARDHRPGRSQGCAAGNAGGAAGGAPAVAKPVSNEALSLISDKDVYKVGDTPVFTVIAKKTCFLTLVYRK